MTEMYLHAFLLREPKLAEELLALKDDQTQSPDRVSRIVTIRQFVSSLLGGAFRILVDCRFALTGVVLERHGQAMVDGGLIQTIASLLKTLVLKLIKYISSQAYELTHGSAPQEQMNTIQFLKGVYSEALKTTEWSFTPNPSPSRDASASISEATKDVRSLYEMLEKLNSCRWLRSHLSS